LAEQKECVLVDLVRLSGINQSLYVLLLCVIEAIIGVLLNTFSEVADEGVPINQKLATALTGDLVVPE
jgi:hypothetical protein